jgi:predicted nucleic acid-binding protein
MNDPFVDTDVLLRLITGDDRRKQAAAATLFRRVRSGDLDLLAPDTVIADAVHVLSSPALYNRVAAEVRDLLLPILDLKGFRVTHKQTLVRALDTNARTNLGFGDAYITATMADAGSRVLYSYDRGFDKVDWLTRLEPDAS